MLHTVIREKKPNQPHIAFHVARDPEFLQGIQDGHHLFPQDWDLTGQNGWWNVGDLLTFVQVELSPESQTKENQVRECFEIAPRTPIYNLGLVAGLLGRLASVSSKFLNHSQLEREAFVISRPAFLRGLQQGAEIYQEEQGHDSQVTDSALWEFYHHYLTPFTFDPIGNTGTLFGWMRTFLASGGYLTSTSEHLDFLAGYHIAAHDWHTWKKEELLTDVGFALCLENEVSPQTLTTMHNAEPWYTEFYQIGYAFGLVKGLLSSSEIQLVERSAEIQAAS